jgi:hypothetical protein
MGERALTTLAKPYYGYSPLSAEPKIEFSFEVDSAQAGEMPTPDVARHLFAESAGLSDEEVDVTVRIPGLPTVLKPRPQTE